MQEAGIQTIPKKKKFRKAKWLSEEALQIAVKRREEKSKGEKERYRHLKAEFQRLAWPLRTRMRCKLMKRSIFLKKKKNYLHLYYLSKELLSHFIIS